jgi:hypothetical protein
MTEWRRDVCHTGGYHGLGLLWCHSCQLCVLSQEDKSSSLCPECLDPECGTYDAQQMVKKKIRLSAFLEQKLSQFHLFLGFSIFSLPSWWPSLTVGHTWEFGVWNTVLCVCGVWCLYSGATSPSASLFWNDGLPHSGHSDGPSGSTVRVNDPKGSKLPQNSCLPTHVSRGLLLLCFPSCSTQAWVPFSWAGENRKVNLLKVSLKCHL